MYDTLIRNARIIDGTAAPWRVADVAIQNDTICAVGAPGHCNAGEVVDDTGLYLAPGFIDIHTHSDVSLPSYPLAESRILQGVTTEIGGNCGLSVAPVCEKRIELLRDYVGDLSYDWRTVGDYLAYLDTLRPSTNIGMLAGHGTIRLAAMGFENRKPTDEEMQRMKEMLRQALRDGCFGLSSGLIYPPGCYSDADEMAELACELRPYGAYYATHMRDEATKTVESLSEALDVARRACVPLQVSHHKVTRKTHWHTDVKKTIAMIEQARAQGLDVTVDQYPYRASSTTLDSNVPQWAFEGGMDALFERLQTADIREKLKEEANESHVGRWGDIYISYAESGKNAWTIGKSIEEIAHVLDKDPADACFDLVLEERGRVNEVNYGMCEEDIEYILAQRFTMTG